MNFPRPFMQRDEGLKGTEVNSEFTLEIQEH